MIDDALGENRAAGSCPQRAGTGNYRCGRMWDGRALLRRAGVICLSYYALGLRLPGLVVVDKVSLFRGIHEYMDEYMNYVGRIMKN